MKIVVLDGYADNPGDLSWSGFEALGELSVYDRTDYKDIVSRIGDAEAVITNKSIIDKNVIENTNLKYVGVQATGYNVVDIKACAEKGITVCNVPAYSTSAVVQHTFAILLELTNKVYAHNLSVKNGDWAKCPDFTYTVDTLMELSSKTLGLIGYGAIGKGVAKAANAFGMNVIYNRLRGKCDDDNEKCHYANLDEIFSESDIISLHCPLTSKNKEIINKSNISKMKKSAIIINTARGGLINETDLSDALNKGRIAGYGCDVLNIEPPEKDNKIIAAKNTIITPHIAWQPKETRERLMNISVENLRSFINGNTQNKVN